MTEGATVVTGASRGIGRALAGYLGERGHSVVGVARTRPDDFPGEFLTADLTDTDQTREVMAKIAGTHKVLHLVNNAGLYIGADVEKARVEDLEKLVAINIGAAMLCAQACLPAMREAKYGRIVNIGSRASLGKAGRMLYGLTKAGLLGMTRNMAVELARDGITVNCVAPGPVATDMINQGQPPGSEARAKLEAAIPVGRMGEPHEVAAACGYFLSADAGYTTGQALYVCGGLSVGSAPL